MARTVAIVIAECRLDSVLASVGPDSLEGVDKILQIGLVNIRKAKHAIGGETAGCIRGHSGDLSVGSYESIYPGV